jgi:tRNA pseudouridine13 synthase
MHRIPINQRLQDELSQLPYLTGHLPGISGTIKASAEHFRVEERLPYTACGEGEHVYVTLRRKEWNTADVARVLQKRFSLKSMDVGWGGRKDKTAVATQTFSLHLPPSMDPEAIARNMQDLPFEILAIRRHRNKIKTGHVAENRFQIIVSNTKPGDPANSRSIAAALQDTGIANFYGEQRFGRQMRNLEQVQRLIATGRAGHGKKGRFMVSVLQSALFNIWLKQRIESGEFETMIQGDVARKTDTGGLFVVEDAAEATRRLASRAIVATGPIYGYKMMAAAGRAGEVEQQILDTFAIEPHLFKALKAPGSRRPAQLFLEDLEIQPAPEGLLFTFSLPSGAYATTVLREFIRPVRAA